MNSLAVLNIIEEFEKHSSFTFLYSFAAIMQTSLEMEGTSALLLNSDLLTIENLMYGMMLPSGNDAA